MNLFAYGTLMGEDGLREAVPRRSGIRMRPARLRNWRRIWNAYREEWGGGVLNAEAHPGAEIWGVLVEGLDEGDLARLDAQEATHVPRVAVTVETEGGERIATSMYVSRQQPYPGPPSPRYEAIVAARAGQAGPRVLESLRFHSVTAGGQARTIPAPGAPPERVPAIKVLLLPKDTNAHGTIFGGVILSNVDLASAVEARKTAPRRYVTKAMRAVEFHEPVLLGDVVNFFTETVRVGRTSITVKVSVEAERWEAGLGERVRVTEAEVILVAVDENGRPTPIRDEGPKP
jgi:acyl-CoA thioesterase YciA